MKTYRIFFQVCLFLFLIVLSSNVYSADNDIIPRSSEFSFNEFQAASLSGVPGPIAIAKNSSSQLFGYIGKDKIAFGEFTFDTTGNKPEVTFRLMDEYGNIREEIFSPYKKLAPHEE